MNRKEIIAWLNKIADGAVYGGTQWPLSSAARAAHERAVSTGGRHRSDDAVQDAHSASAGMRRTSDGYEWIEKLTRPQTDQPYLSLPLDYSDPRVRIADVAGQFTEMHDNCHMLVKQLREYASRLEDQLDRMIEAAGLEPDATEDELEAMILMHRSAAEQGVDH